MTVIDTPPETAVERTEVVDGAPTRRTRLIRLAFVLGVVAVIGLGVWLALFSSVFATQSVRVNGAHQVSSDAVVAAAAVPLGRPMLRQDTAAIAARVATLKPVRSATVDRRWPDTLVIKVVERTPVLAVRQPDGYLLTDATGVAYRTSAEVPDGVVVTDADPDNSALLTDLSIVAAALPAKLTKQVTSVKALDANSISLVLKSGVTVSWGTSLDSELKGTIVVALLKQKPRSSIDVTSPHNPAIR